MMFGRKKKDDASDGAATSQETTTTAVDGDPADGGAIDRAAATGPQDLSAVSDVSTRVDLGSVLLTPAAGTELRLEIDQDRQEVTAVQVGDDHGAVQIQVFAAPRSSGIWDEIREEIAGMINGNGGTVEEVSGPFGDELRTRLAQPGPQGRTVFAPAIFAGVDGPRWFLRAVYSGAAAVDDSARAVFDDVLRTVVIARGDEPRAPREMLPLQMPTTRGDRDDGVGAPADDASGDDLQPFERGPEITEVR